MEGTRPLPEDLRTAVIEALSDQFRAQVYFAVCERPGVTIRQIATRIGAPRRSVRHQVELLVMSGLVQVQAETKTRNTRERHYRAISPAKILEEDDEHWDDRQRRRIALSVVRTLMADVGRAVENKTFGAHERHTEARVPGEVDRRGWTEIAEVLARATEEIETIMIASFARLEAEGEAGMEVVAALLLFEGVPWEEPDTDRAGPRPSPWSSNGSPEG